MTVEIRPAVMSISSDIVKKTKEICCQVGGTTFEKMTQTEWIRKMNKICQIDFEEQMKEKEQGYEMKTEQNGQPLSQSLLVDTNSMMLKKISYKTDNQEKLAQFLFKVIEEFKFIFIAKFHFRNCLQTLHNNSTVDIFKNVFRSFQRIEENISNKTETIKEVQTFVDLKWSRHKKISHMEWMPDKRNNIVAIACIENMQFDTRVDVMNQSRSSTILLWNLNHVLLKAQMILTAPNDIVVFRFHPVKPYLIIGGLETGQVVLWDLKHAWQYIANNNGSKAHPHRVSTQQNNSESTEDDVQLSSGIEAVSEKVLNEVFVAHSEKTEDAQDKTDTFEESMMEKNVFELITKSAAKNTRLGFDDDEKDENIPMIPAKVSFVPKFNQKKYFLKNSFSSRFKFF
ncbi:hypothetical protein RFI_06580 [Reticulomyxa filosa]|uniref:Uncharacterized protein n=1 Tax=Reticulomyxa filosa TaxID=46433 RepID=X6NX15_RETFI|nr:hypothetical protein RFI_06580 [Reticulomyxa filosa]|eukprot:ETO30541.1 hypothetical protein RFI_06580 [Reticulomyxa filosa]